MAITQTDLVPPLESGDRLPRPEFHRRYAAMPEHVRAELVEGVVYMASAVNTRYHARPHGAAAAWLSVYYGSTPGVEMLIDTTVLLGEDNELQPDLAMRVTGRAALRSRESAEGYLVGPPELVVEITASSAAYDAHAKREVYRRHGVREYLLWRTRDEAFDAWSLRAGRYVDLRPDGRGLLASRVLPGLVLDVPALLAGNLQRVLERQQAELGRGRHAAFREQLAAG